MKTKFTYLTIIFFLFTCDIYSQYYWNKVLIPDSVETRSIFFKNEAVYFGTNNGVYFSEDNFETFEFLGLENKTVLSIISTSNNELFVGGGLSLWKYNGSGNWEQLVSVGQSISCFHESNNGNLFFGSWGSIYRSQDNGITWDIVWDFANSHVLNDITENSLGHLFAGTTSFGSDIGGIYKSVDNGDTWSLISLEDHMISSIECNSTDILFAGSESYYYSGVYKSLDTTGHYWSGVYQNNLVADLKITDDNTLIIGCAKEGFPGGVFVSYDDGENWEDISGDLPSRYIDFINLDQDNYLYCNIFWDYALYKLINPITTTKENPEVESIKLYPNPTKSTISISNINGRKLDGLIIFNQLGQCVVKYDNVNDVIDTSELESGIYIIKIFIGNQTIQRKLIIK